MRPERAGVRVLVDLKPALDGYAGIPQESRLLYRGLSEVAGISVEGLIQHGGRRLRAALPLHADRMTEDRRINHLSRFVVSLYQDPHSNLIEWLQAKLSNLYSRQWLRLKTAMGVRLPMSSFQSELFEDFVWRTFFAKTLNAGDKSLLSRRDYRVLTESRHTMHSVGLATARLWGKASYPFVDTRGFDYFVTQTPFPGRLPRGTEMVVRYHDAVPILMPHTINDKAFHQASHFHALKSNVDNGAWFSCISHATRADLLKIFPQAEDRSFVIHNMVSDEYSRSPSEADMVNDIVSNRRATFEDEKVKLPKRAEVAAPGQRPQYLLMVSTIEPRKNHLLLIQAWERLRYGRHPDLKIVFVGNTGWDQGPVLKAFQPWAERGELFWLSNVPASELKVLYQHAAVTVCPGYAEGFDYSGVEAMKCGTVVASSDIPVHREIYENASAYFSPYNTDEAAAVLDQLLAADAADRRAELAEAGRVISARYSVPTIMPRWEEFFRHVHARKPHPAGLRAATGTS